MLDITEKYLNKYAVPIDGEPSEIALHGFEQFGNGAIGVDDPEGTYLEVLFKDEYADALDAEPGTDKRTTFVVAKRNGAAFGPVGWSFPGLIKLDDLRWWYRDKFGIADAEQEQDR